MSDYGDSRMVLCCGKCHAVKEDTCRCPTTASPTNDITGGIQPVVKCAAHDCAECARQAYAIESQLEAQQLQRIREIIETAALVAQRHGDWASDPGRFTAKERLLIRDAAEVIAAEIRELHGDKGPSDSTKKTNG